MWIAAWVAVGVGIALMIEAMAVGDVVVEEGPRSSLVRGAVLLAAGLALMFIVLLGNPQDTPRVAGTLPLGALVASGMVLAAGIVAVFSEDRRQAALADGMRERIALRPRFRAMTRLERLREDGEYSTGRRARGGQED
jgi:hypothetical protein